MSFDKCSQENNPVKILHEILKCLWNSVLTHSHISDMGSKLENDFHSIGAVTHKLDKPLDHLNYIG